MYYVYEHWRPDTDTCFYVGKGKLRRAWSLAGRNRHHTSIVSKLTACGLCVDVRIIARDLSEEAAYAMEMARIALLDRTRLANLTAGGEGGTSPSEETRRLIGAASKARANRPEQKARLSARVKGEPGAFKGRKHRAETIAKLSAIAKLRGGSNRVGKKHTDATKAKISAANLGRVSALKGVAKSAEWRAKIGVSVSAAITGERNPFWGRQHSEESKRKISETKRARRNA